MTTENDPARLARVAKGKRPQYFSDPAIDKLLSIVMTLAGELSVTRDRLDTLERMLDSRGVIGAEDLEAWEPDDAAAQARETARRAYLARVLRAVEMELQETVRPDMPASRDDILKHL